MPRSLQEYAAAICIALVPFSIIARPPGNAVPLALLFAYGLFLLVISPDARHAYLHSRWVISVQLLLFLWVAIGALRFSLGWKFAGSQPGHILLCLVTAATFVRLSRPAIVFRIFAFTAVLLGLYCCWQHFGMHVTRVTAPGAMAYYAVIFAVALYALAVISLVQLLVGELGRCDLLIHVAALVLSVYGGLLTLSRGPFVAFLITSFTIIAIHWHSGKLYPGAFRQRKYYWILPILCLAVAVSLLTNANMVQRFGNVANAVPLLAEGSTPSRVANAIEAPQPAQPAVRSRSTAMHIEMWKLALRGLVNHPWHGIGMGKDNYGAYVRTQINAGRADSHLAAFRDAHDVYLTMALEGGIPGLLIAVLFFIGPIVFFLKYTSAPDTRIQRFALCGLGITVLWALAGITDTSPIRSNMTLTMYCFIVSGFAVYIVHNTLSERKTIQSTHKVRHGKR